MEEKSFSQRVKESVINNAQSFKEYYLDYEYLLYSTNFINSKYYIIKASKDNYLHLTGLNTKLTANEFFDKCYNGNLEESDFDFCKKNYDEKEVKGSVRRKINCLPFIINMFSKKITIEEDFTKNRIKCSFATTNNFVTLGFVLVNVAIPMTLLKGNELNSDKAIKVDLILRKKKEEEKFSEIVFGSIDELLNYATELNNILSTELLNQLTNCKNKEEANIEKQN